DDSGLAQGLAFGVMNAAWAIGAVVGPAGGGAIAGLGGDAIPLVLCGVLCARALVVTWATRSNGEGAAVLAVRRQEISRGRRGWPARRAARAGAAMHLRPERR